MTETARTRRAKEIMGSIEAILLHDWDPLGVADVPEAQDEYSSYVGPTYRLLVDRATPEDVAHHLSYLETVTMGSATHSYETLLAIGRKLLQLDVRIAPE